MKPTKQNVYLRVPPELKKKLEQTAGRAGLTLHALIISALWQLVERRQTR